MHITDAANSSSSIDDTDGNCPANARNPNTLHSFDFIEENESFRIISNRYIQKEQTSESDSSLQANS